MNHIGILQTEPNWAAASAALGSSLTRGWNLGSRFSGLKLSVVEASCFSKGPVGTRKDYGAGSKQILFFFFLSVNNLCRK